MGKHSLDTDFDLIPLALGVEVPDTHRADPAATNTTPISLPLLPSLPVRSVDHVSEAPGPVVFYAQHKYPNLLGLGYRPQDLAPRYRRTGAKKAEGDR
jgi:hypothetical protein